MLNKLRVRTFAKFIGEYGEGKLMDALEKNEIKGIVYHYSGELVGDYDEPLSEEATRDLILQELTE
jgi:hypothetical protein